MKNFKLKLSQFFCTQLYCSYAQLHCIFNEETDCFYLNLTARSYQILVDILLLINFDAKTFLEDGADVLQYNSLRNLEYQQLMFDEFIKLHNIESFDIPSHIAWKLCIYFGLVICVIKFDFYYKDVKAFGIIEFISKYSSVKL